MKRAAVVLYVCLTLAVFACIWMRYGPFRAWMFGAFACAVPQALPRRPSSPEETDER